jgi:hypothetical protein
MSYHNGRDRENRKLPPAEVASSFRTAVADVLTLGELQLQLLKADVRDGSRRILASVISLAIAGVFALACFPIALLALAYGMTDWFDISMGLACLFSFLIGLAVTGLASFIAYRNLRRGVRVFDRSRTELAENIHWLKTSLGGDPASSSATRAGRRTSSVN